MLPIFLWTLNSFGFWANPDATQFPPSQIGIVKNVSVGKLDCAGRLLDLNHLQTWCRKGTAIVQNEVVDISNQSVATTYYYDNKPNETDAMITWMVAAVEGNPQTIGYQIGYRVGSGTDHMLSGQF